MPPASKTRLLPPVIVMIAMPLMWLLDKYWPVVSWPGTQAIGAFFLAVSFAGTVYCAWLFHRHKTAIKPFEQASFLILAWPYTLTRNPVYLLMIIFLAGWALYLASLTPFLIIPLFAGWIHYRFVLREEVMLKNQFQQDYLNY